jgi:hypothetical protein
MGRHRDGRLKERAGAAFKALRRKGERKNERGQQNQKQTQAVDADEIFGADRGNPGVALDDLKANCGGVEVSPQHKGIQSRDDVEYQGNRARIGVRPNADRKCPE